MLVYFSHGFNRKYEAKMHNINDLRSSNDTSAWSRGLDRLRGRFFYATSGLLAMHLVGLLHMYAISAISRRLLTETQLAQAGRLVMVRSDIKLDYH